MRLPVFLRLVFLRPLLSPLDLDGRRRSGKVVEVLWADQGGGGEVPLWLDRVHSRIDTFLKKLIFVGV